MYYISAMEYFQRLNDLLQKEKAADLEQFASLTQATSVFEKRANGLAWYPIAIKGTELGKGDYLTIELERTTHHDIQHQLRFGAAAALFSNIQPQEKIPGVITFQSDSRLKLNIREDELPDWCRDGKLGVELLFDDNSYNEMFAAIQQAETESNKGKNKLIEIITQSRLPSFNNYQTTIPSLLNEAQKAAVQKILSANELAIVHGPPGTGKTTTLVQAIKLINEQVQGPTLVVAPSNAAVDLLSDKLSAAGLNVLRIGNPARVSDHLMSLTLDGKMAAHQQTKEIKKLRKQANEFRDMAHRYKRNFGKAEREQRKALFDEAHKIIKDAARIEQYIIDDLINQADVITATLVGANHHTIQHLRYHTVVIDEAGQALEPACWIPILKAERLILAGDHLQLPPTIKSAPNSPMAETLLEKLVAKYPEAVTLLQEQYRMNEQIMQFSSQQFYQNKLIAHPSVAHQRLGENDATVLYIDTAGCGFEETQSGSSIVNTEEARFLVRHLLQQSSITSPPRDPPSIAIISPYKSQVETIKTLILQEEQLQSLLPYITVNTVDSFQGQERDVVYISMARSNNDGTIGFLSELRRMNVAMTRARKQLVVIGDSATIAQHQFYQDFIVYTERIDAYKSAWEFIEL
jgi:ATP-dependent RNA/DNA helicase IGHMBP2